MKWEIYNLKQKVLEFKRNSILGKYDSIYGYMIIASAIAILGSSIIYILNK